MDLLNPKALSHTLGLVIGGNLNAGGDPLAPEDTSRFRNTSTLANAR